MCVLSVQRYLFSTANSGRIRDARISASCSNLSLLYALRLMDFFLVIVVAILLSDSWATFENALFEFSLHI